MNGYIMCTVIILVIIFICVDRKGFIEDLRSFRNYFKRYLTK